MSPTDRALIGYTGFVGGNLWRSMPFDSVFNTANIRQIRDRSFGLIVSAGVSSAKWRANESESDDWAAIECLLDHLSSVRAERFVLISSVDVYTNLTDADETSATDLALLSPYGRNRRKLEQEIERLFDNVLIVRLTGLFGLGLRKNALFDLATEGRSQWTHGDSIVQYYDLSRLAKDIDRSLDASLAIVNLAPAPVRLNRIARECFGVDLDEQAPASSVPLHSDVRTRFAAVLHGDGDYLYSARETCDRIREWNAMRSAG